jgi:hypothetical protein
MIRYVGIILLAALWIAAFAGSVFLVAGGPRRPSVHRLLVTMRFTTWFFVAATVLSEILLVFSLGFRPEVWIDEPPWGVAAVISALFLGLCWLGQVTVCSLRLSFALVRLYRANEFVEWDKDAAEATKWCRRFRLVHQLVCWHQGVELERLMDSTLTRSAHRSKETTSSAQR